MLKNPSNGIHDQCPLFLYQLSQLWVRTALQPKPRRVLAGLARGLTLCPALYQNQSRPSSPAPSRPLYHLIMSVLDCRERERECTATQDRVRCLKQQRITSWWFDMNLIFTVATVKVCRKTSSQTSLLSFLFPGWSPYLPASERVTYKSSSKPRARFLSGPVSLSICLYLSFTQTKWLPTLCSTFFHPCVMFPWQTSVKSVYSVPPYF